MIPYEGPNPTKRSGRIIVLGSTGSIGVNTLEVITHLREQCGIDYEVVGLAAGRQTGLLAEQAARFGVECVATSEDAANSPELDGIRKVMRGTQAATELVDALARPGDLIIGAIVGAAGVEPSLAAVRRGCDLGLANKEALVAAGCIVMDAARSTGARIIPIDSEHSAIFQCLQSGKRREDVAGLILTASGGPFREWSVERMRQATVEQAVAAMADELAAVHERQRQEWNEERREPLGVCLR